MFISVISLLVLASCATTTNVENSWRDPEASVSMSKLNKVLIVALVKNDVHRRATEIQLAALLKNKGVPSSTYLKGQLSTLPEGMIKQKLKADGFDGAIILRLIDVERDISYVPGAYHTYPQYYGRFWPYLANSWNTYYQPGYFTSTKKFTIETNVYSLKRDKLIWSGITSSIDPESMEKMIGGVTKEVYGRMKKDGFIVAE